MSEAEAATKSEPPSAAGHRPEALVGHTSEPNFHRHEAIQADGAGDGDAERPEGFAVQASPASRPSLREAIIGNGWRQGVLIPPELYPDVQMQPFGPWSAPPDGSFCIVVSQDCDLVHDITDVEPAAEVVVGEVIPSLDKTRTKARHPRELHLELVGPENASQALRIVSAARGWIRRERLADTAARQDWTIKSGQLDWIIAFLGNRYSRTAYPDEFEKRAASLRRELKGLKKQFPKISQFLFDVEPMDELPPGKPYSIRVVAVLEDEAMNVDGGRFAKLQADIRRKILQAVERTKDIDCEDAQANVIQYLYVGDVQGKAEFEV